MKSAELMACGMVLIAGFMHGQHTQLIGSFSPAGDVGEPRSNHTATLLSDGKILLVGGFTFASGHLKDLKSTVVYDPQSGRASPAGDLIAERSDHTATLLDDGRVLIAGGRIDDSVPIKRLATAELYDPATRTFSSVGNMRQARDWHASVRLANGRVLVCGGLSGREESDSAELYDPLSRNFKKAASMLMPRLGHSVTLLQDGRVLVASGVFGELYDAGSGRFSKTGKLRTQRVYHSATLLKDGSVLLAGGMVENEPVASAEAFVPSSGTFLAVGNLKIARKSHTATLLPDGRVLIFGGTGPGGTSLSDAEVFDPVQRTFSAAPSSATHRTNHSAVGMPNGTVLLIGGRIDLKHVLSSVDVFRISY